MDASAADASTEPDSGPEPCDMPGAVESEPCGMCGTRDRFCTSAGVWEHGICEGESGECVAGTTGSIPCGNCGTQTARCTASCEWDVTSECTGEGECSPGTTTRSSDGCAAGETRDVVCSDACMFEAAGDCEVDHCDTPGAVESVSCGMCGTLERFCNASNVWEYGACTGEGECMPGTMGSGACGMCGTMPTRCTTGCSWESAGACTGEGSCMPGERQTTTAGCGAGEARVLECDSACAYTIEAVPCMETCTGPSDCTSGVCTGGACQPPSCTDGVANGLETDVDCGGSSTCPRCPDGRLCPNGPSDCVSSTCTDGRCGDVPGHIILLGHDFHRSNAGADHVVGNAVQMTSETGTIEILLYDEYADTSAGEEVANLEAAIMSELSAAGRTVSITRLSLSGNLTTALTPTVDVFILAEQELGSGAPFSTIAASWEPTLRSFVDRGGVIISTNFVDSGWELLNRPTLVSISGTTNIVNPTVTVWSGASGHPIAAGFSSYTGPDGSAVFDGVSMGGASSLTRVLRAFTSFSGSGTLVYDAEF